MGEYAEMMLDGTCCAGCGEYLDGGEDGIPRYCSPRCRIGCEPVAAKPQTSKHPGKNRRNAARKRRKAAAAARDFAARTTADGEPA